MEDTEDKAKKKLESRKFVVWLVWCIIAIVVVLYSVAVVVITKDFTAQLGSLVEKVLSWFFGVSMLYIGANAGQKVGFAFADAMSVNKEGEK